MKRRLVLILLLLVGGAIVNVAAAWCCALLMVPALPEQQNFFSNGPFGTAETAPYRVTLVERSGVLRMRVVPAQLDGNAPVESNRPFGDILPTWTRGFLDLPELAGRALRPLEESHSYYVIIDARGWPCLATWGGVKVPARNMKAEFAKQGIVLDHRRHGAVFTSAQAGPLIQIRFLPWLPIWPGFAINTLFYAAILWMLFAVPFALRRLRRIQRGLCPKCAYDLRNRPSDSTACPECGSSLKMLNAARPG